MYTSHSYPYQLNSNNQQQQQQQPQLPYPPPRQQFPNPYAQQQQPPQYQPPAPQHQPPAPQQLFPSHPKKTQQPPTQPSPQQPPLLPSQPPLLPSQPPLLPSQPPLLPSQPQRPQYSPFTPGTRVPMPQLQQPDPTPQPQMSDQEIGDPRFVELMSLSTKELEGILEDDDKANEMVQNLEEVKQKKLDKEMSIAENKSLADFNLSREPRLTESRSQYIVRLQEAQKFRESYILGKAKLESVKDQTSLDTALALLQAATAHAEEDSEEVADEFLKGDIPVDDFLEKFMPRRQTAHLRHIKSEKMQEILTKRQQSQSAPQSAATPNSAMPPYPAPHHQQYVPQGNLPYNYQPQRPAPRPPAPSFPYGSPQYGPGAHRMPTLGPYQQ